ncbi:MAG: aminotransferase class III-fold pyridoxal phosphate-dependent enzyme [Chloroflexi bacterium]|nr:aminotransferase class III-fold pyridoxal phosphate-dependent enzyme [Chloroflexota bacterium]
MGRERYEAYEHDRRYLAGGISAPSRINPALGGPLLIERGDGPRLFGADGRTYLDFHNGFGSTLLGHNHPAVRRAIEQVLDLGIVAGAETVYQARLAARICELVPCAEQVRFAMSGSEATNAAIRLARTATNRSKILKFEGHFHGLHEHVVFSAHPPVRDAKPGELLPPLVESAGVPPAFAAHVLVAPWNDLAAVEWACAEHGDDLAAVVMEPINYNSGGIPAEPDFLRGVRELTRDRGTVLIFDEILSGFRTGTSCAQGYYDVTPDVCLLGKAVANGAPISVIAGRREVMAAFSPTGGAAMSGTYSGHLFGVLAALATLDELSAPGRYDGPDGIYAIAERLYDGLREVFARRGVRCRVQGLGARFGLFFGLDPDIPVCTYQEAARHDASLLKRFVRAAIENGVYFHTYDMALGHHGFSTAHTARDVDEALDRIDAACRVGLR